MNIKKLSELNKDQISGKRAIVRMDFDVPGDDYTRIEASLPTLKYLLENGAKLLLIGHKGRPDGERIESLSLKTIVEPLSKFIGREIFFVNDVFDVDSNKGKEIYLLENLRFNKGEEDNSVEFSKKISNYGEIYINEAFATSHRAHASFVGIPNFIPAFAGFRLESEVEKLSSVLENPKRPLVFLISGVKEDKIEMIKKIRGLADKILVGGRLPYYIENMEDPDQFLKDDKLVVANLNPNGEDITIHSIEKFEKEINSAQTIVLAGVVGKYEDKDQIFGTKRVFEAVSNSSAYKIAGGGDTESVLTSLGLTKKFDWISVGGGAMLEFLAGNKLPGIEILKIQ